jgi:hypothetical protein
MQTPKVYSTQITQSNSSFTHIHPISPYKTKIKILQTSIQASLNDLKFKTSLYKWSSKYLLLSSLLSSSILLSLPFLLSSVSNSSSSTNSMNHKFKYIIFYNFSSSFLYNLFQPSYNYLLYKEVTEGLTFLNQNIEQYIDKVNEDNFTNYTLFKNSYHKLIKKLS